MKIEISNRQALYPIHRANLARFSRWVMGLVSRMEPSRRWARIAVILTDHEGMRPVQRAVFNREDTTDVVSVAYPPFDPRDGAAMDGEVIVNLEQARDCAGPAVRAVDAEVAWYLAHGLHHLAGADDATPAQRDAMHARERAWLREAADQGLLPGLLDVPGVRS